MGTGKLIVVEGACDGIGKTTQFNLLREHLEREDYQIISHHFPTYNTYQGKPVEMYLQGTFGQPSQLSPYFINSLYAMDRAITWNIELEKEYLDGKIILLDRYTTSSLIYQSALIDDLSVRKQFIDYVCDFEYNKLQIAEPDNIIFLYAPFELVTEIRNQRKQNDGIEKDIHESNLEFMKKVYDNSMFIADYLGWDKIKCNNENEMKTIDEIHKEIYKVLEINK